MRPGRDLGRLAIGIVGKVTKLTTSHDPDYDINTFMFIIFIRRKTEQLSWCTWTQFSRGPGPVCLRASEVEKSDIDFQVQRRADNIIIVCTLVLDFSARTSAPLLLAPPSSFVPPTTPRIWGGSLLA